MPKNLLIVGIFLLMSFLGSCQDHSNTEQYFNLVRPVFKGDLAYKTVAFVEKYWRVAGNTGFNESIFHVAAELEKAGYVPEEKASSSDRLTYRIEKRAMENPTWEPVEASVTILGQERPLLTQSTNRNMVYLNSHSTPDKGISAEVVHIQDPETLTKLDVKGKILYTELPARQIFEEGVVKQGALGIITYNNPSYLQPEKNRTSIQFRSLPHQTRSKAWGIALSYGAKEQLKAALDKGKVELHVNVQTKIYASEELTLVADIKGSELPEERLVFSAHVQEPGANDNASGVGAQLEMAVIAANLLQQHKIGLHRTLTFLWGDEILSTRRYIQEDKKRAKDIKWGISLDMVGENTAITGGSFLIEKMPDPSAIWTRGKDQHSEWGGDVLSQEDMKPHYLNDFILHNFKEQGKFSDWEVNTNPFEGGSDHTPFLDADIPGLLLWHFTDQFYHTDNDRLDKVSQETLKNVGIGALASVLTLVNADTRTALETLHLISEAAHNRMEDEFGLSKKNVASGQNKQEELKILATWEDWYLNAMRSVSDLEKSPTSKLQNAIKKAQAKLGKSTQKKMESL